MNKLITKGATSKRLTEKRFDRDFIPTKNVIDPEAWKHGWDGNLYETYGADEEYIKNYPDPTKIWTLVDCDGKFYILAGYHYVNRFGYFITEKPWDNEMYEVRV